MLTCSVSQQDLAKPTAGNMNCSLFSESVHASVQLQRLDTLTTSVLNVSAVCGPKSHDTVRHERC